MRRGGLTDAADVIALTLDGEQDRAPDRPGVDEFSSPIQLAAGEPVLLEDPLHGLEVELGGEIEHGEVLAVELLGLGRLRVLLCDEVGEQVGERRGMAAAVHRHECRELQESGVNPSPGSRVARGDLRDQVALEPFDRVAGRERR